jgi:uncharacterized protein HemY
MQVINRKSIFMLSIAASLSLGAVAQSLDEGIKMVKYERYTSAEKILQPMAASDPIANYYYGITQLEREDTAGARATFAKYPEDLANMSGMARLAFVSKNAAEGQRLAAAIADKAKRRDWQTLVYVADAINYGGGNPQDAIKYYQEALKRGGDNVYLRIGLGDAYQKLQGGGGEGMNNYEAAVAKDTRNSLGYYRMGELWYAAHNYPAALENLGKAKDADPANPLPYKSLANAYFWVGKYDLAKQNIEQYFKLSDQTCDDRINYGNILFLAKDYAPAISMMQQVIDTCGERAYMYRVLGYSQFETKDYQNALQNMRTFFQKQTDPAKILNSDFMYLGKTYAALKQMDSAVYYITRAESLDTASNKRSVYMEIAETYRSMNTDAAFVKSAEYYKKAVEADTAKATATDYFWWGVMEYYAKQYDNAARVFETMETRFPDQPSATYWRGRVAAAVDNEGKTGAALPFFTKWLGFPENESNTRKPSDLKFAYEYLAIVAYNKDDKAGIKEYIDKIKAIDPTNALAKQLEGLMNKPAPKGK